MYGQMSNLHVPLLLLCGDPCSKYSITIAGGNLVLDGRMSAGSLVSFMLYVTSLNGALQARHSHPNAALTSGSSFANRMRALFMRATLLVQY